jgi:hypothetical protein
MYRGGVKIIQMDKFIGKIANVFNWIQISPLAWLIFNKKHIK